MLFNEGDKTSVCFSLGDVILNAVFTDVEVDLAGGAADVAKVGVGHFAGAVYDAAHDGELHAFEVAGLGADTLGCRLEIEECAAAGGAGDEFGF